MPQKSRRRCQSAAAIKSRWAKKNIDRPDDVFNPELSINMHDLNEDNKEKDFLKNKISILDIGNLFGAIAEETSLRSLSVLIYLSLMYFGLPWRKIDLFLKDIGALTAQTCNKWSTTLIEEELEEFLEDNRGGKHDESFYDIHPELENLAKLYALDACKRKAASFTCSELAGYLDEQYYELTGEVRIGFIIFFLYTPFFYCIQVKTTQELIRSERACCRDLHRWGCKFDKNTAKPYWAGHERPDVIEARTKFVHNFLTNQDKYYWIREGKDLQWNIPKKNPTVLICIDFFFNSFKRRNFFSFYSSRRIMF